MGAVRHWLQPSGLPRFRAAFLRLLLLLLLLRATAACGGELDVPIVNTRLANWNPSPPDASTACAEVCNHIVDICGVSADDCLEECEAYRPTSDACAEARKVFLSCMKTVKVICHWTGIETVGCDDERKNLRECPRS